LKVQEFAEQGRQESNPQPLDLESSALPIELLPYRTERERFELSRAVTPWVFSKHLH
jgi:hypothetical protein